MLSTSRFYKLFLSLSVLALAVSACSLFSSGEESPAGAAPTASPVPAAGITDEPTGSEQPASSLVASVTEMTGAVQVVSRSTGASSLAFIGQQLEEGDVISTGADSRTRVDFANGTYFRAGPNTQTEIVSVSDKNEAGFLAKLSLKAGEVWVVLTGGELIMDTPSGVASVRGSYMSVDYNPISGETTITCLEGECHIWNDNGGIIMFAGQIGVIRTTSAPVIWGLMSDADVAWWLANNPEASVILPVLTATVQSYNGGILPFGSATVTPTPVVDMSTPETCVVGTWGVSAQSLQNYMVVALANSGLSNESVVVTGAGTVTMGADGAVSGNGQYTIEAESVGGINGVFTLSGNGSAGGRYVAESGVLKITGVDKIISAELNVLGIVQVLDLPGLLNVLNQMGFGNDIDLDATEYDFPYSCSGQYMSVEIRSGIPLTMERTTP